MAFAAPASRGIMHRLSRNVSRTSALVHIRDHGLGAGTASGDAYRRRTVSDGNELRIRTRRQQSNAHATPQPRRTVGIRLGARSDYLLGDAAGEQKGPRAPESNSRSHAWRGHLKLRP